MSGSGRRSGASLLASQAGSPPKKELTKHFFTDYKLHRPDRNGTLLYSLLKFQVQLCPELPEYPGQYRGGQTEHHSTARPAVTCAVCLTRARKYRERSLIDCPAALRLRGPTQGLGWLRNDRASPLCRPGKAPPPPGTWTAIASCSGVSYDTPFLCALRVQRFGSRVPFRPCGSERRYCEGTRTWAPRLAAACHGQCGS